MIYIIIVTQIAEDVWSVSAAFFVQLLALIQGGRGDLDPSTVPPDLTQFFTGPQLVLTTLTKTTSMIFQPYVQ